MEERNSRYRCLKMKAAAAWALAVLLSLLSVFGGEVPYVNEIQMLLAALVLLFPGTLSMRPPGSSFVRGASGWIR